MQLLENGMIRNMKSIKEIADFHSFFPGCLNIGNFEKPVFCRHGKICLIIGNNRSRK